MRFLSAHDEEVGDLMTGGLESFVFADVLYYLQRIHSLLLL